VSRTILAPFDPVERQAETGGVCARHHGPEVIEKRAKAEGRCGPGHVFDPQSAHRDATQRQGSFSERPALS
jgi:hypothetical protein